MDAIYARQSLNKKDSLSVEGQIELCRKYAGSELQIFCDKGFSGKNIKRPAFTELIQAVESGKIQKIFVYRLDRFSRSIADFSQLWKLLEQHGVEFQSVTEHFDTSSPIGRAMLNIVLVFAQLERETTAERVKDNYIHRFSLGAWPGGPAPYGFELGKTRDDEGRIASALVAGAAADTVKHIFEEYAKPALSLRGLARALGERGIAGPRRETWDNVTLSRILHSPLYVRADEEIYWHYLAMGVQIQQPVEAFDGVHACNIIGRRDRSKNKYNDLEGQRLTMSNHEGLIESGLWLEVQRKLSQNLQISQARAGKYSWLTGLMKCEKCGYAVKINFSKPENKFYLICSGRSNMASCDSSIHIDLRELEAAVAAELEKMLLACPAESVSPESRKSAEKILALEQKIERLISALTESSAVSAVYISREIDRLHTEREKLLSAPPSVRAQTRLDFGSADFQDKKLIASEFISRISLSNDAANIFWKL